MKKIDPVVVKETKYVAYVTLVLSIMMQAVFLLIGKWNFSVLLGNLLSVFFSVLNFLLMGITVQKALGREEKEAKTLVRTSQLYRNILLFAVAAVGVVLPIFNTVSVIVSLFFPRVAVSLHPILNKKN